VTPSLPSLRPQVQDSVSGTLRAVRLPRPRLVKQLSDRAILLLHGRIEAQGTPKDVINRYIGLVLERQSRRPRKRTVGAVSATATATSEILGVQILNARREALSLVSSGEAVT